MFHLSPFFSFDGRRNEQEEAKRGCLFFEKASESARKILRNKTSRRLMVRDKESHRSKLQAICAILFCRSGVVCVAKGA